MKKLLLTTLFLIYSVSLLAQQATEGRLEDGRILKQAPPELVKGSVYLKGNLATWVNAANEFVVYAETAKKQYLFALQMEKVRDIKPATGKFESITFFGDAMVLNDGKNNYYFGIVPVTQNQVLEKVHMAEKDFVKVVQGYGISRHAEKAESKKYSLQKLKAARSVLE